MEGFIVSARKYRPDTFDSVVGQGHVTNTLKNALITGQVAHAFLFSGPRGVGKTTCARILAKSINCLNLSPEAEPCNECDSCNAFADNRSLNIHELDGASNNSVDDIRKIIEQVRYVPTTGKKSIFIIDEVHMLSSAAFNAFLKTLEEPPPHAIFILATTEKHKILPTILSRCQKFDFRRIKVDDIAGHLKNISEQEKIQYEYEGLQLVALKADGALRDALSIFDQIVSFSNRNVTYKTVLDNLNVLDYDYFFKVGDLMLQQDHNGLLLMLNEIVELGFEPKDFMSGLVEHFRNLLVAMTPKTVKLLETSDNIKKRYLEQAKTISPSLLLNAFQLTSDAEQKMKGSGNPRLLIELAMIKLAYLQSAVTLAEQGGAEKKKSLAPPKQENSQPSPSPEPKESQPYITTETQSIVSEDSPDYSTQEKPSTEEAKPSKEEKPSEVAKTASEAKAPVSSPSFSIPSSMDDIDLSQANGPDNGEEAEEERVGYDESINIDQGEFLKAFEALKAHILGQEKHILLSLLKKENSKLDHNKWIQVVTSDIQKKQLDLERDIVLFMRDKLNAPRLFMEIVTGDTWVNPKDSMPYTNEEKLEIMKEKNPDLLELMKKFDVMIGYG